MQRILVINGPNLNLLGRREPQIYGHDTLSTIAAETAAIIPEGTAIEWKQSNHEGDIVDYIQEAGFDPECLGIVLNAGAYTHTSLAIADAIAAVPAPVIEVHLSNVFAREEIRHRSLIAPVCRGSISGLGKMSYILAVRALINN